MPIFEVTSTDATQVCANCGRETRLPLASLQAGLPDPQGVEPLAVLLPPCPDCKSTEFLFRSPDSEPEHADPGSFGHLHRLMVDHVHSELVKTDRVHPKLRNQGTGKADPRIARPIKQTDRDKYFARGLKIARSAAPGPTSGTGSGKPTGGKESEDPGPRPPPPPPVDE